MLSFANDTIGISHTSMRIVFSFFFSLLGMIGWFWFRRTIIMNPNSFRFRLTTLDEISMPVGDGQIVGFERFWFDGNALNGLLCTVFSKQPASRFQIFRFNPFAVRIKRMDAVGNQGLAVTDAV
ncbi:Uncharacterised protein [Neisseria gonorrhoeae]|nr:Uncharacterised protein [Neisseria gonorrhoeae]CNQ89629.1 Uncharacterised protein [Neisseria gonorrhoeae]